MLIDGKYFAAQIQSELKKSLSNLITRKPSLVVVQVGDHAPSHIYIKRKMEACATVGIQSHRLSLPLTVTENELLQHISVLNQDIEVDGILVQLPLPPHINTAKIIESVHPGKDVDGFHPINVGKLLTGSSDGFVPCTPLGVKELLIRSGVSIPGKHAIVLGRSNIVGKPMAALLLQNNPEANATVTIAHSHTKHLKELCLKADIIISAIGQPKLVTSDMIKEGAVVIDVGISTVPDSSKSTGYRILGDVDFEDVKEKASLITPVPGGVGPMTIAMLLSNTVKAFRLKHENLLLSQ